MRSTNGQNAQAVPPAPTARRRRHCVAVAIAALACGIATGTLAAPPSALPHAAPHALADAERQQLTTVVALIDHGSFAKATAAIDAALADSAIGPAARAALAFERERMRRIGIDFPLTAADVRAALQRDIPDLRDEEFAAWDVPALLEQLMIDGEKRYFARAVPNLYRVSVAARLRRAEPWSSREGPFERLHGHHADVVAAATGGNGPFVLPRRVRVTQSLTVDADAVPAGEMLRAWIPFPRSIPGQQQAIALLDTQPARHQLAPEDTLQRTVYLEQPAVAGTPTTFSVSYELDIAAQHRAIDPAAVEAARVRAAAASDALAAFTAERPPHVVFTEPMRRFSAEVVGDERNPYRIAQKLFAAVDRIPWASAREYSTLSNIGDYALRTGHADCGQQTLLLITLLRLNGIPARWQSGMVFSDGSYDNLHDWGMVHLEPYGWVPMDVTTGVLESDDATLRWFYLGGLDAYRIAFNDDFSTPFVPPKRHFRSETVDSQRGEVEWDGGNLYYDQWDYAFQAKVL